MTLEDFFLTKAGAVREEDVRGVTNVVAAPGSYHVGAAVVNGGGQFPMEGSSLEVFGNGVVDRAVVGVAALAAECGDFVAGAERRPYVRRKLVEYASVAEEAWN